MLPFAALSFDLTAMMSAPSHAAPRQKAPQTRAANNVAHVAACRRAHKGYDARTDRYRDAHGKLQRCTR